MKLKIKFVNEKAKELYNDKDKPLAWTKGNSGIDLRYVGTNALVIKKGQRNLIMSGISVELIDCATTVVCDGTGKILETKYHRGDNENECIEIQIRPRSGLALKNGITIVNTPGTVDYNYRGEIGVILLNTSKEDFTINQGDRIAQMVVCPIYKPEIEFVENVSETDRGSGGFGSSGVK